MALPAGTRFGVYEIVAPLVSSDGQSFVMNSVVAEPTTSPITVILNWKPRL